VKTSKYDPIFERHEKKKPWQLRLWPMRPNPEGVRFSRSGKRFEVVVAGRRCLEAGTMITTPGGPVAIENLKVGDEVIGWDGEKPIITTVAKVWDNGVQEVFNLYSNRKKYLGATAEHALVGYKDNEKCYVKNKLPPIRRQYVFDMIKGGDKHVENAYALGAMLGNGCCRENKSTDGRCMKYLYISSPDGIVPHALAKMLGGEATKNHSDNFTWKISTAKHPLDAIPFYREWCENKYSYEKIADWNEIDTWDKESCLSFLAGLIDTDGSIYYVKKVQKMFVNLGMQAESVIRCAKNIIFKYLQEDLTIYEDVRTKYKNGNIFYFKTGSSCSAIRIFSTLQHYLISRKEPPCSLADLGVSSAHKDFIKLSIKDSSSVQTYDITVSHKEHAFMLHNGAVISFNSGKTERAKRKFVKRVMRGNNGTFINPRYCVSAPTTAQAKKIFWNDLKMMIPPNLMAKKPNETDLIIQLIQGNTEIFVAGLDQPQRIEGAPVDGFIFDESDDIKSTAWEAHIYPCFADRHAWAMFLGAPNGMGFLHKLSKNALTNPTEWDFFQWKSAEVLDPAEIQRFRSLYDERLFRQEFEGEFVNMDGRAYYSFEKKHYSFELDYNIYGDLIFCFDFNSSPGIAVAIQEQKMPFGQTEYCHTQGGFVYQSKLQPVWGTGVISEVWIKENSNTKLICEKLYEKFHIHQGKIFCYGDASGGNHISSGLAGTDWDIIKDFFSRTPFFDRIFYNVPRSNPSVRGRINATNCRLKASDGTIRMAVDAKDCPHTIEDFEQVTLLNGSLSDINKKKNMYLTHLTDAIGSYISYEFPVDNLSKVSILDW
jgi:hypothetical protein